MQELKNSVYKQNISLVRPITGDLEYCSTPFGLLFSNWSWNWCVFWSAMIPLIVHDHRRACGYQIMSRNCPVFVKCDRGSASKDKITSNAEPAEVHTNSNLFPTWSTVQQSTKIISVKIIFFQFLLFMFYFQKSICFSFYERRVYCMFLLSVVHCFSSFKFLPLFGFSFFSKHK